MDPYLRETSTTFPKDSSSQQARNSNSLSCPAFPGCPLGKSYPLRHQLEPSLSFNAALSRGTLESCSGRQAITHFPLGARELAPVGSF